MSDHVEELASIQEAYPEKFAPLNKVFKKIHAGDRIFISTACAEPQYLVRKMLDYVESNPKSFFDAEVLHVWSLGVVPYTEAKFKSNFRLNSFFISDPTRDAINSGDADYAPIFLHDIPSLFYRGLIPVNVALIQTSLPDNHGFFSLGISVDIVRAAVEKSRLVIAQVNPNMPRVHGNSYLHIEDIDHIIYHEEPLLEYQDNVSDETTRKIGEHVATIIEDGDTIQVGYGATPNAIMDCLKGKKHLGVHTELLSDGLCELIKAGVIDNTRKTIDKNKTVCSFCMGMKETYEYINGNPAIAFQPVDYTNDPLTIARIERMTAINSALQIDLTGQATAESLGAQLYSGVGGQSDFMRGALMAPGGKTILTLPSTAKGGTVSRIVPILDHGAGVTLTRGDIQYVVTEYGIAYLYGKNIRERAMSLITIAHPKFRSNLIKEAQNLHFIYRDQAFVPGKRGEYPEHLEVWRTTKAGMRIFLRPVRIDDEPLLKDFFYGISDKSLYRRFLSVRNDMPHERLQEFVVIDYSREMVILVIDKEQERETVIGVGQYSMDSNMHTAEVALIVKDNYQRMGVGYKLLKHLTYLAKSQGLLGFTADVFGINEPMLNLFGKMEFDMTRKWSSGVVSLTLNFRDEK